MNIQTMSKDATKKRNNSPNQYSNADKRKQAWQDNIESNLDRVGCRTNSASKSNDHDHDALSSSVDKKKAHERHRKRLAFLTPLLESIPDTNLQDPAKDLASQVLSTAIHRKHCRERVAFLLENPKIPNSAQIKFKLTGSKTIQNLESFKSLATDTDEKVNTFKLYLKNQMIEVQKMELTESETGLQNPVIHQTLQFANRLVRYYKVLFNSNSKNVNQDEILSFKAAEFFLWH